MCHMSRVFFFFGQSVGASRGRVCYQRGLPRIVFVNIRIFVSRHVVNEKKTIYNDWNILVPQVSLITMLNSVRCRKLAKLVGGFGPQSILMHECHYI